MDGWREGAGLDEEGAAQQDTQQLATPLQLGDKAMVITADLALVMQELEGVMKG